ncbi:MAG: class I SAM-dependent methyltransferase [Rhodospirillales bacterium]
MSSAHSKEDIQRFWGSLYDSLYGDVDASLTHESLVQAIEALEDMFRYRRHMAVVEMPLHELQGKRVLEIGCGAGGHSALFASYGAVMTSVDITPSRVNSTQYKFDLLGDAGRLCRAMQADAENLPFEDSAFEIVYSNGVLHHTLDTEKALEEVFRVLKPGGRAVIMLYCKSSWQYWFNLWFCVGIILGRSFGDPNWLGKATEWGGKNRQTIENPITRCYTASGIRKLFYRFKDVTLRKEEFYFGLIPKLGRLYRRYQKRRYGEHPGGLLVYGAPWPIQSPLELRLGKRMGFAWFISACKPD